MKVKHYHYRLIFLVDEHMLETAFYFTFLYTTIEGQSMIIYITCTTITVSAGYNFAPLVDHQLSFSSYSGSLDVSHCFNIGIIDNSVIEERRVKNFTVVLSTDNNLVTVGNPAVIEIIDNDCKLEGTCVCTVKYH